MSTTPQSRAAGFSLLELMICLAIFLVISGVIMSSMMTMQKARRTNEIRASLDDKVRAVAEMIIHDIGQAGKTVAPETQLFTTTSFSPASSSPANMTGSNYTNGSGSTLCGSTTSSYSLATVTTTSNVSQLYLNEAVLLDAGQSTQEIGWICGSGTVGSTLTIQRMPPSGTPITHAATLPVYPVGAYAEGILSQRRTGLASSSSQILLMGDIDEDGTPVLVGYRCSNAVSGGTLTRTVWNFTSLASSPAVAATILLDNVGCYFSYSDDNASSTTTAGMSSRQNSYYAVVGVSLFITATSDMSDQTGNQYTVFKSYLNIQPRNLVNGMSMDATQRQWTPTTGIFASTTLP